MTSASSARATCPSCYAALALRQAPREGSRVRCPQCQSVFPLAPPAAAADTGASVAAPPADTAVTPAGSTPVLARSGEYPFLDPPQAADELGRLGPFRVLDVLGKGGMGVVFRAEDTGLRRLVAVKVMLPHVAADPGARARFLREARAQAKVEHDHVAAVHLVSEDGAVPFLAMPLLKGSSLTQALRADPTVGVAEAVRIAREIAAGLAAAHATGLVHRDVKPCNVWLEGDARRVKLLDFGLARAVADPGDQLTRPGAVVGTPAYMSPEQARGQGVDHRTDLFSLGCVLYLLLAHRPAFAGGNVPAILVAIVSQAPRRPSAFNVLVPPALDALVMELLAKVPADRPETAAEVAERLAAVEAGLRTVGRSGTADWSERPDAAPRVALPAPSMALPAPPPLDLDDDAEPGAAPPWNRVATWLMSTAAAATAAAASAASAAAAAVAALRQRGGSHGAAMWLAGAGAAAAAVAAILVLVFVLNLGRTPADAPAPVEVVKNTPLKVKAPPVTEPIPEGTQKGDGTSKANRKVEGGSKVEDANKVKGGNKVENGGTVVIPPTQRMPFPMPQPPQPVVWTAATANTLLVTRKPLADAGGISREWVRFAPGKGTDVIADGEVVCLPGFKADVTHPSGLTVRLWGNVPDLEPAPVLGTRVRFNKTAPKLDPLILVFDNEPRLDADITLLAGRVHLTSTAPALVQLGAAGEVYGLGLAAESEVVFELTRVFEPGRPFDRARAHPTQADLTMAVVRGSVAVRAREALHADARPPAAFTWSSKTPGRFDGPLKLPAADGSVPAQPDALRRATQKTLDLLPSLVTAEYGTKLLMTQVASDKPTPASRFRISVGVYGLGVLAESAKDLDPVVNALTDRDHGPIRYAAATALRAWLIDHPEQTAALGDGLDVLIRPMGAGAEVLRLLHAPVDPGNPNLAKLNELVERLNHESVAVRELARWNLLPFAGPAPDIVLLRDVGDRTAPGYAQFLQAWRTHVAAILKRPPAPR
ncbi:MAG TPA: serine/threonine-protein kinase [Urbifossiella sp.]|nr:serine/threonine-protein kinase [Urbifossiella sp.]